MGKQWKQYQTLFFGGSKITADGDCSHEIKRRLLLGRKVMTNLDSILKTRDITLPTNVRLFKAMVLPVVMYGCESLWKKLSAKELMLLNCGVGEDSESPLDCKEIQAVHSEGDQPWDFFGRCWEPAYCILSEDVIAQLEFYHCREPAWGTREALRPWQRSWGRRLGIRKGGIEPQESPWKFSSIYPFFIS